MSSADWELAARLATWVKDVEQAATEAMAEGDWIGAADLEEERVVKQHELAELLRERSPQTSNAKTGEPD